jgi:Raf kinase inhibitor-like YbhB/YbcL family protein
MLWKICLCCCVLVLCWGCRRGQPQGGENANGAGGETGTGGAEKMSIKLTSSAFQEGGVIPVQYACTGQNQSPPLAWTGVPAEAKTLALVLDDPDVPISPFVHWVVYNLPATTTELPADVPKQAELANGGRQGKNGLLKIGYGGPCPPPGPAHRYYFKLYALNTELTLPAGASKQDLLKAMYGHIVDQGQLMGRFKL